MYKYRVHVLRIGYCIHKTGKKVERVSPNKYIFWDAKIISNTTVLFILYKIGFIYYGKVKTTFKKLKYDLSKTFFQMEYRLQSMYNHMVERVPSVVSPFYFILLGPHSH